MRISVEANGYRFTIPFPLRLVLNSVTIPIIAGCTNKYSDFPLKEEHLKALCKELVNAKRSFGKLVLVDVSSSDGSKVKITL